MRPSQRQHREQKSLQLSKKCCTCAAPSRFPSTTTRAPLVPEVHVSQRAALAVPPWLASPTITGTGTAFVQVYAMIFVVDPPDCISGATGIPSPACRQKHLLFPVFVWIMLLHVLVFSTVALHNSGSVLWWLNRTPWDMQTQGSETGDMTGDRASIAQAPCWH